LKIGEGVSFAFIPFSVDDDCIGSELPGFSASLSAQVSIEMSTHLFLVQDASTTPTTEYSSNEASVWVTSSAD
jgi:hypothetical protein